MSIFEKLFRSNKSDDFLHKIDAICGVSIDPVDPEVIRSLNASIVDSSCKVVLVGDDIDDIDDIDAKPSKDPNKSIRTSQWNTLPVEARKALEEQGFYPEDESNG